MECLKEMFSKRENALERVHEEFEVNLEEYFKSLHGKRVEVIFKNGEKERTVVQGFAYNRRAGFIVINGRDELGNYQPVPVFMTTEEGVHTYPIKIIS